MNNPNTFQQYLITDPRFYSDDPDIFSQTLTKALIQYKPDYACFRDKRSGFDNREKIKLFVKICKREGVKSFINSDIKSAIEFGYDGVHLPSSMFGSIKMLKDKGLQVFASCHNRLEMDICYRDGADMITLSPIFISPDKGEPLGIDNFNKLIGDIDIKVFALGGIIDEAQIEKLKTSKATGFASIRYFIS